VPDQAAVDFIRRLVERTPRTWVTTAIVVVNVAVFGLMVATGVSLISPETADLLSWGADFGPATVQGQWWRLLSCTFVHIGLLHVTVNMWALWQGGRLAERFYGNGSYLVLYLVSGIGASVASLLWHPTIVSAGASGAIFGVFGGLLAVVIAHRAEIPASVFHDLKRSTVSVIVYNVLFGSAVPGIDNAAHIGGLLTGFAVGLCLRRPLPAARTEGGWGQRPVEESNAGVRLLRVLPVALLIVAGAIAARRRVHTSPTAQSMQHFDLGLEAFEAGDPDRAMKEVEASLGFDPDDPRSLSLRGDLRWSKGDRDGAEGDFTRASGLAPRYAYPRTRLAWIRQDAGDLDGAISYFNDAIRLDGEDHESYGGRAWVRLQQGKLAEALADADRALAIDPRSAIAVSVRSYVLYDLRRWPEALAAFRERIQESSTEDRLPDLYVWAIRARTGEKDAAAEELASRVETFASDVGRKRIAEFVLGRIAEADFLAEADATTPNGQNLGRCEAWYFVGMKHQVDGDREGASSAFRKCLETNAIDTPAWSSARAELAAAKR
jgi:membrane associated rhomboid family serine protease/tetratricopeptide (TPR) repeat protein